MESSRVSHSSTYSIGTLGNRVSMEGEFVVVLDEDVKGAVVRVPGVSELLLMWSRGHVQE